ncbi:RDD family protein [Modestobacter lapidis]|nr:hypothetical protein [Modestobacter lapidis]
MVPGAEAVASGRDRVRASGWDYLVIVGWLAVLTVLGVVVRGVLPPGADAPSALAADAVALVLSVLPVWTYLTLTERGAAQATWGKRRTGLRVVAAGGNRAGGARVAVRNAVKLLPWQLAHVSVARVILEVEAPVVIGTTYGLSLLLPVVSIAMAWRDPLHRALHHRIAGTRVVPA